MVSARAAGAVPFQPSNPLPPPANPPIKQIEPGVFQLGQVRLDKNTRIIQFPGTINMTQGLIEYVVVHGSGKIHESLVKTEAEPYHVHLAVLLLSNKNARSATPLAPPSPTAISSKLNVRIWLTWKQNNEELRFPAEDLILNLRTKKTMDRGPWRYIGSRLIDGTFLAQRDGSLIAVIDDPDALVDNARPGSEDDENWQIENARLPNAGTPVAISIQLEK